MRIKTLFSRKVLLTLSAVVLLSGFAMVVARSGPLASIQVTTVRATSGQIAASIFGIGTIEARRSYLIGPTVAGRVKVVHVDVGDSVEAGTLLAEIDPLDLDARIQSAGAGYARASSAVLAAQAQLQDAMAREKLAMLNAKRWHELSGRNFVSTSALEAKQQELESASAAVNAGQANLTSARQEQQRLKAEQDGLQQQKRHLRLLAPQRGLITSREAEAGSTVVAGQAVLRMIEPDSLWVKVRIDQGRSHGLAVGQAATVVLRSHANSLTGKVDRIEPVSDSVTEERIVQVALDALPVGLNVGEMAEVTIQTSATTTGIVVPNAAIRQGQSGAGLWCLQAGKPVWVPVTLGHKSLEGMVQVTAGIQQGDEVIVYSERALSADTRIRVVEQLAGASK